MVPFSDIALSMRASQIRELMKYATDPRMISFAGGMPNNDLFPTEEIDAIYKNLPLKVKQTAFQYGPTSGYPPLLESLKGYLKDKGLPVEQNKLMITTGSLQAINLITKIFINSGDALVTEDPCFIGAIATFKSYAADIQSVPLDEGGISISGLKKVLQEKSPKVLYITPYFHNPAGIIYNYERKHALLNALKDQELILIEDDPYGELYFDKHDKALTVPMMSQPNPPVPICYVGSFSKILGPGMRLGWILGPAEIVSKCALAKQSMDACSPTFTQVLAHEFLAQGKLAGYVEKVRKIYARRAKIMLDAMDKYFPHGVEWNHPKGGFYIWVTMPKNVNADDVLAQSIKKGAVFVVGKAFDPNEEKNCCFRLAYSHTPEDLIESGVKMVADAIKICMK